jgi:aspartate racemase
MKRLGIIGGVGPESTVAYYRTVFSIASARTFTDAPPVVINSLDVFRALKMLEAGALDALVDYLSAEIEVLARADVSLAVIAANTPHIVFDRLRARSPIPLVSIVEAARDAAQARGLARVALLGTRFTMSGRFYPEVFAGSGVSIVAPNADEQAYVHGKYVGELLHNEFLPETRDGLLRVIAAMRHREDVDGVLLAGTELPLILPGADAEGVPLLDTAVIHVQAAFDRLWGQAGDVPRPS